MSYHWLTQISPSATYGLALLAVAWLFVMRGCTQGSWLQLLAGWLVAGILAFYKLHFFIASALLLLLAPSAVLPRDASGFASESCGPSLRSWLYVVTIVYVQKVPGVPLIRFDGSGVGEISRLVKGFTQPGALRDFLADRIGKESPWLSNLLIGVPFVLLAALGLFAPLLVILAIRLRRRTPALLVLFPLLLVANFLTMFLGLALDFGRSTPDELSHRPVIVMYFAVVAWVGGAAGLVAARVAAPRPHRPTDHRSAWPSLLMAVPAFLGAGVQRMWAMRTFSPRLRVPIGLYRAAEYMRDHGAAQDVFQDSQLDRTYTVAALSERRAFVARHDDAHDLPRRLGGRARGCHRAAHGPSRIRRHRRHGSRARPSLVPAQPW